MRPPLVLLGAGYTLARLGAREARAGREVWAATRDPERRVALEHAGAHVVSLDEALAHTPGAHVAVSVPPEVGLDGELASAVRAPQRTVYLSSTGVYGAARGHVDEDTPLDPGHGPTAAARIDAERVWRDAGAGVVRVAGIYGPRRGMHARLGTVRLPEGGGGRISRVHVDDLGDAVRVALERAEPGSTYVVADGNATPQAEVAAWLCPRLGLPMPGTVPVESLHVSLRGDRAVDASRLRALGWKPRYPSFREGYEQLLAEEGRGT